MNYSKLIRNLRAHDDLWSGVPSKEEKVSRVLSKALHMRNQYDQKWIAKRNEAKRKATERRLFRDS